MPELNASLGDMMTALQRADAAGSVSDASGIAQMIQQTYPDHVQAALGRTPPMMPPTAAAPPAGGLLPGMTPPRASMMNPAFAPDPSAQLDTAQIGLAPGTQPAQGGQGGPGGGIGGPAAPLPADGAPGGPSAAAPTTLGGDIGNFISAAGRSLVGSIPGGNALAGTMAAGMHNGMALATGGQMMSPSQMMPDITGREQAAAQASPMGAMVGGALGTGATLGVAGAGVGAAAGLAGASGITGVAQAGAIIQKAAAILGSTGGGFLGRTARMAATGAVGGAATAAADVAAGKGSLENLPYQAATDAAIGAVAGPTVGRLVGAVAGGVGRLASGSWDLLARKFTGLINSGAVDDLAANAKEVAFLHDTVRVDPDGLEKLQKAATIANGGQPVPLVQLLKSAAQGSLRDAAGKSPALGNFLADAAKTQATDAQTLVPEMLADAGAGTSAAGLSSTGRGGVQSVGALEAAREQTMSYAMHSGPDPIANQRIQLTPDDAEALSHPTVMSALRSNPTQYRNVAGVLNSLTQSAPDAASGLGVNALPRTASLPTSTFETLRQTLSPRTATSDEAGDAAREAMAGLRGVYERNTDYKAALATYAQHSAFIDGHGLGLSGKAIEETPDATRLATNATTGAAYTAGHGSGILTGLSQTATASPAAANGVVQKLVNDGPMMQQIADAHGAQAAAKLGVAADQLNTRMTNLRAVAPGAPVGKVSDAINNEAATRGAMFAAAGHLTGAISQGVHAVWSSLVGERSVLSEPQAQNMAQMLLDPRRAQGVINLLRAKGANESDLATLRAYAAAATGAIMPKVLGQ